MAGTVYQKTSKQYPDPKDTSPMQEFYLPRGQFMDPSKHEAVSININGYVYEAKFGEMNRLPKDIIDVLERATTAIHPMANAQQVEIARGGEGRNKSKLMESQQIVKTIPDYEVVGRKNI